MSRRVVIYICLLVFCVTPCVAQSLSSLQAEQRAAKAEIERITIELKRTTGSQKDATQRLKLLETKIASRREVLSNLNAQISLLDTRLGNVRGEASVKEQELRSVYSAYKQTIEALFASTRRSSPTTHAAARKAYFGRIVADSLSANASKLQRMGVEFRVQADSISSERSKLDELQAEHKNELATLDKEIEEARLLAKKLGKSADELNKKERVNREKIEQLERKIREAIQKEVSRSNAAGPVNTALSSDFAKNKGRLPWPLTVGAKVIDKYGMNQVQKGVKLDNKGVNIRVIGGSREVRSIFQGEVKRVFTIMGLGGSVIVRHGAFLSVYSALGEVSVAVGDKIELGSLIGNVSQTGDLHFELWKENTPLNPSEWLSRN